MKTYLVNSRQSPGLTFISTCTYLEAVGAKLNHVRLLEKKEGLRAKYTHQNIGITVLGFPNEVQIRSSLRAGKKEARIIENLFNETKITLIRK